VRRFRAVFAALAGRSDRAVVEALVDQLDAARAGTRLAEQMIAGLARADAHQQMSEIEHTGDSARARLVDVLATSLTTPIDREDLFRLSRSIDDVLDTLRDFVRESHLYRISDQSRFAECLATVASGIDSLEHAVRALPDDPATVRRSALDTKKAAGAIGRLYQYEIAALFGSAMTAETMKTRELVRRLEIVGMRLGDAADALADGAMKRWH
jgi:uncharacterized protein Yka (UPF0111/DUF47 family)